MSLSKSFRKRFFQKGKFYRINYNIVAQTVRLLDETGKQIGIFSRNEALRKAKEKGVDLVEIAPTAQPPVCKIIDFKKFRYLESKKERESKRKAKNVELKQIMLSPFIGEHDFFTKQNLSRKFLTDGHRLKVAVKFTGRQLSKKEFGFETIKRLIRSLEDLAKIEREPHFEGHLLVAQLIPVKKRVNYEVKNQESSRQKIQDNQNRQGVTKTTA